jgi:hypothetical protein
VRRSILWIALIAGGALAGGALAAPLALTSEKLGGGNSSIVACDGDGFTPSYTTSRGNVTSITVSGIAQPACGGGILRVSVTNSSGASITAGGPQTISTGATSVTVSVTPQPSATQVAGIQIVVEGP